MLSITDFKDYTKVRMEDVKACPDKFNMDIKVWIWSEEWQAYWRPNSQGYTNDSEQAGVYSLKGALRASGHCCPQKNIWYIWIPVDFMPKQELTKDFFEATWEIYQEWLALKNAVPLPDYEKAYKTLKEKYVDND